MTDFISNFNPIYSVGGSVTRKVEGAMNGARVADFNMTFIKPIKKPIVSIFFSFFSVI